MMRGWSKRCHSVAAQGLNTNHKATVFPGARIGAKKCNNSDSELQQRCWMRQPVTCSPMCRHTACQTNRLQSILRRHCRSKKWHVRQQLKGLRGDSLAGRCASAMHSCCSTPCGFHCAGSIRYKLPLTCSSQLAAAFAAATHQSTSVSLLSFTCSGSHNQQSTCKHDHFATDLGMLLCHSSRLHATADLRHGMAQHAFAACCLLTLL